MRLLPVPLQRLGVDVCVDWRHWFVFPCFFPKKTSNSLAASSGGAVIFCPPANETSLNKFVLMRVRGTFHEALASGASFRGGPKGRLSAGATGTSTSSSASWLRESRECPNSSVLNLCLGAHVRNVFSRTSRELRMQGVQDPSAVPLIVGLLAAINLVGPFRD